MAYNMLLLSVMLLFMIIGAFSIKEYRCRIFQLTGLITFYLMVCSYTAIGMFMSSITHYQIVSAIATFILLFPVATYRKPLAEYDFIRDLTHFLAINGRAERMVARFDHYPRCYVLCTC